MKITETEIIRLAVPMRRPIKTATHDFSHAYTVLVQMRTDAGLIGTGWCFAFEARKVEALAILAEDLAALYAGRDPRAVRDNHAVAWKDMNFLGHAGASMIALAGCWFDAGRCEQGLRHLDGYRRAWDEKRGIWRDRPHHDTASHGADAFRMFAAGYRPPGPVQAMPETVGMDWDPLAL